MSQIITSNKALLDDSNALYSTDKGLTTKNVKDYYNKVTTTGFILTQAYFDALTEFEKDIKPIANKIIEVMPFIGNNLDSQMVKLKFKNNENLIPFNGFDASFIDADKGVKWDTYLSGGAKGISTGLKNNDFTNGFGFFMYSDLPIYADYRTVFGKGSSLVGANSDLFFLNAQSEPANSNNANASSSGIPTSGACVLGVKYVFNSGKITKRSIYKNLNTLLEEDTNITISPDLGDYSIGAQKNNDNVASSTYSFLGKIRMLIVTSGDLDNSNIVLLNLAINKFVASCGKTF